MFAVISPAKKLDFAPATLPLPTTEPALMQDSAELIALMKAASVDQLRQLMRLSPALATLNWERYQKLELPLTTTESKPAALAFAGDVYRGLEADSLETDEMAWMQEHAGILSGLFGLLRPLDRTPPHRLEMGTRLETGRGKNLYQFWGERIVELVNQRAARASAGSGDAAQPWLVNLASAEYFKAIRSPRLRARVITPIFQDKKPGQPPKVIAPLAKYARGRMLRFMVEQRLDRPEGLRDFNWDRYRFQAAQSDSERLVFQRIFVPAKSRPTPRKRK